MGRYSHNIPEKIVCFITEKKVLAEYFISHIPRVGETVYLGDIPYKVIDVIHQFCPHDINIKVEKIKENQNDGE